MTNDKKRMSDDVALELITREVRQTNNGKLLLANLPAALRNAVDGLVARGKLSRAKFLEFGDAIEIGRECVIRQLGEQRYGVFYVRKGRDEDCVGDYTGPLARIHAVEYAERLGYASAQVVDLDQKTKKQAEVSTVTVKAQYMDLMIILQDGWGIIHSRGSDSLKDQWGKLLRECGDFAEKPPVISAALNARIYQALDEGKIHFVDNVFLSTSLRSRYVRVLREHASLIAHQKMQTVTSPIGSESDENARRAAFRDEGFGQYEVATVQKVDGKEVAEAPVRFANLSDALARIVGTPTSGDKTRPWIRDCSERDSRRQFLVIRGVAQVRQLPPLSVQRLIDDEMTYARQGTFSPSYLEGHREAALCTYLEADPAVAAAHASLLRAAWQKKLDILPAHRDTPALIAATLGLDAKDLLPVVEVLNDSEKPLCKARLANGDVWTIEPGPGWVLTVTSPTGRQSAVSLKDGVAELVVGSPSNGVAAAAVDLEHAFGEEHPDFNREEHAREVSCGDTRLGDYWEWVVHQVEADGRSVDDEVAGQVNRCVR